MYMIIVDAIKSKMNEAVTPLIDAALLVVDFKVCTKALTFSCPNSLKPAKSVIDVSLTPVNSVKKTMSTINKCRKTGNT
jgi:hypothetical protein